LFEPKTLDNWGRPRKRRILKEGAVPTLLMNSKKEPVCSDFNPDEPRKSMQQKGVRNCKSSERKQPLRTLQINQETTDVADESNFEQESMIKIEDCFDNTIERLDILPNNISFENFFIATR
jgi:hypothetical protein